MLVYAHNSPAFSEGLPEREPFGPGRLSRSIEILDAALLHL
jgi:hypothetical protein